MPNLKSKIASLADTFAAGVLAAVRSASLQEILAGGSGAPAKRKPGRPAKTTNGAQPAPGGGPQFGSLSTAKRSIRGKGGRLARRSPSDIEHVIGLVVATLKEHKDGLRSEQLQKVLKLHKKEVVRPLELALKAKRIAKKGQRRSTTYFAA
jgi:hypothetical protein